MSQPAALKEQLNALEHLQEVDLQIDQLKKKRLSLPALLKTLDDGLNRLKAQRAARVAAIEEINKVQRQTKAAMDLNSDRLTRSQSRLEGIQNSQEYAAVNKELEQLRRLSLTLEDQLKKSSVEIEAGNKDLEKVDGELSTLQGERDAKAGSVSGQDAEFNGEITRLSTDRKKYTAIVDTRLLALYDRVRAARGGLGIAPATGGRCKACNMMVPPQLYNEVQKGLQSHGCPSCHRILFIPDEKKGQSGEAQV